MCKLVMAFDLRSLSPPLSLWLGQYTFSFGGKRELGAIYSAVDEDRELPALLYSLWAFPPPAHLRILTLHRPGCKSRLTIILFVCCAQQLRCMWFWGADGLEMQEGVAERPPCFETARSIARREPGANK